jgi:peptidoglycan/LPS O-acetylase OafA/YrhL
LIGPKRGSAVAGKRFEELDSLRGIAALWVVVFHLTYGLSHFWLRDRPELSGAITPFAADIEGPVAVDLFFVISGFVICMTVERSRTVVDFAASRFARLFPVYWMAVAISTAVGVLLPSPQLPVTPGQGIVNLTMLQDYIGVNPVDPSYWSLSIELGFYGLMATLLLAGQRHRIETFGIAWVTMAFVSPRLLGYLGFAIPWRVSTALALAYANLFYAGILFFRIRTDRFTWWRAGGVVLCLVLRIAFASPMTIALECAIFAAFALCVANRLPVLRARPLLFFGAISYSLYVVHQPLGYRVELAFHALGAPPWLNLAATLGTLLAISSTLTYTVERPATRLIRRIYANWRIRDTALSTAAIG